MRLLTYNIAYGTGGAASFARQIWTVHRYLRAPRTHLDRIIRFISECDADIVGLVEVDTGSYRTGFINQVESISHHLGHYHVSAIKYEHRSLGRALPIMKKQGNAIFCKDAIPENKLHYLPVGFKKLIIEAEIKGIRFFLVHLALQRRARTVQLEHLTELAAGKKPVIIAGDFNCFGGPEELAGIQKKLKLVNANQEGVSSYPSWKPSRQLDAILCSKSIKIKNFSIPKIHHSDHLPLILDFEI
ncbi:MAG: hypothetical protein A2X49_08870 [Lentisphaerae bacterium GWF2_52_8]|nr:MAG: hypothetical protein A2X49_08870 [Lentisphaerae bacterium GWF2_52_8]